MSKKTIVLADSSYTIRRIVELTFSEEKDIRLVTFENSLNLREKLIELHPEIVLVDIKLPEFSGYDVCKFIQDNPGLKNTKVFLLKGGFEPIDERLLRGLRYVDIITKPFDSNALVTNIKKLLEQIPPQMPPMTPEEAPTSFPEDFSEIEEIPEADNDISFLDIKEEIDSTSSIPDEMGAIPSAFSDDEILPSEEITRAQPEKDSLSPTLEDVEDNPFSDDIYSPQRRAGSLTDEELNIKRNIEMQEKELEIGSLTLEEFDIKKDIESRGKKPYEDEFAPIDEEPGEDFVSSEKDTSDMFPGSEPESSTIYSGDDLEEPEEVLEKDEMPIGMDTESVDDLFAMPDQKIETSSFEDDGEKLFAQEPDIPDIPDIKYDHDFVKQDMMDMGKGYIEDDTEEDIPKIKSRVEREEELPSHEEDISDLDHFKIDLERETAPELEEENVLGDYNKLDEDEMFGVQPMVIPEMFEPLAVVNAPPKIVETFEPPAVVKTPPIITETFELPAVVKAPPKKAEPVEEPRDRISQEMLLKIEDKLTHSIKEMLWEIVPPLAEKIIKKEIEALKAEAEKPHK